VLCGAAGGYGAIGVVWIGLYAVFLFTGNDQEDVTVALIVMSGALVLPPLNFVGTGIILTKAKVAPAGLIVLLGWLLNGGFMYAAVEFFTVSLRSGLLLTALFCPLGFGLAAIVTDRRIWSGLRAGRDVSR
jgi:hypothetical protein